MAHTHTLTIAELAVESDDFSPESAYSTADSPVGMSSSADSPESPDGNWLTGIGRFPSVDCTLLCWVRAFSLTPLMYKFVKYRVGARESKARITIIDFCMEEMSV